MLQLEDSGDALDIDLDDPFQAQMLDITQPIVADESMLKRLKQQVGSCPTCFICVTLMWTVLWDQIMLG